MKVYALLIQTDDQLNKPDVLIAADKEALRTKLHAFLEESYSPCPLPSTATVEEMQDWFAATNGGIEERGDFDDFDGSYFIWEYEEEI